MLRRTGSDVAAYMLAAITVAAATLHTWIYLKRWPDWHDGQFWWPFALRFLPFVAAFACVGAVAVNRSGYGKWALRIAYLSFVPTLCVLALDQCIGAIGIVD